MKSAKTKAEEFFEVWGNDTTDATIVYALELLLKEHERDTKRTAVALIGAVDSTVFVKGEGGLIGRENAAMAVMDLEVKDEETNN